MYINHHSSKNYRTFPLFPFLPKIGTKNSEMCKNKYGDVYVAADLYYGILIIVIEKGIHVSTIILFILIPVYS